MKIGLKFIEPHSERNFSSSKLSLHSQSFIFITVLLLLRVGEIFTLVLVNAESAQRKGALPFLIIIPLGLAILLLGSLKFPRLAGRIIVAAIIFFDILSTEFLNQSTLEGQHSYRVYVFLGMNIEVLGVLLVVARISWVQTSFVISILQTHNWLRIPRDSVPDFALIFLCLQLVTLSAFAFFSEKGDRRNFSDLENIKSQLKTYEEIMNSTIQSSVMFMKNDEAVFYNKFAKRNLDINAKSRAVDTLKMIKVIRRGGINEFLEELTEKGKSISKIHSFTLYDIYKDCESYGLYNDLIFQPGLSSVVGEMRNALEEETKTFIIQLGPSYWHNDKGVLIILSDISHILRYYNTLDIQKDNLLATVSHDLRAPLNGILGMLNLLLDDVVDESSREKLKISVVSAKLMQHMINDILDFALMSKGKLRLNFESTNVSSLVDETVKALSLQAQMKGIDLEIENLISDPEKNHIVDGNRLRQVLFNLIGNAIKFTKKGKVLVRVNENPIDARDYENDVNCEAEELKEDEISIKFGSMALNEVPKHYPFSTPLKRLDFEVEDTGVGMKQEDLGKLFKLFSRVTAGHDEKMSGIGLGLAISQSLVMMMNGKFRGANIKAESTFGKGSVFKFPIYSESEPSGFFKEVLDEKYKLPIFSVKSLDSKNSPRAESSRQVAKTNQNSTRIGTLCYQSEGDFLITEENNKNVQVLLVDDDQLSLLVATKYLKTCPENFSYKLASNGEQALQIVCENSEKGFSFDIILMDCNMPFMDGFQASKQLKAMMKEKQISPCPIVALTGNSAESDIRLCNEAGMEYVLTKPFTKEDLIKTIREALKHRNSLKF